MPSGAKKEAIGRIVIAEFSQSCSILVFFCVTEDLKEKKPKWQKPDSCWDLFASTLFSL